MKTHNFNQSMKVGKIGEEKILNYLNKKYKVTDVRHKQIYQKMDIDFILNDDITIEIKTDSLMNKTGNFFFETISNLERNNLGCIFISKADDLYYLDNISNICYILNMKKLQIWLLHNIKHYQIKQLRNKVNNNNFYTTEGILVPIVDIIRIPGFQILKL